MSEFENKVLELLTRCAVALETSNEEARKHREHVLELDEKQREFTNTYIDSLKPVIEQATKKPSEHPAWVEPIKKAPTS